MSKSKTAKKRATTKSPKSTARRTKKRTIRDASGGEDRKSARKYNRGGRIEAYTWGEVSGKRGSSWPF